MGESQFKVVILDRPNWYQPILEQEELGKVGAKVVVGWATMPGYPTRASRIPDGGYREP